MITSNKITLNWTTNYRFVGNNEKGLTVNFDAPASFGGEETAPSPMENVLASLAACSSIHIRSTLKEQKQQFTSYHVEIQAEREEKPPRTFTKIHLKYILKGNDLNEVSVKNAIADAEGNYWSVGTMIKKAALITSSFEILKN
jgi:putative redox protein